MLYPDLESEYYPDLSKFNLLLFEKTEKLPFYNISVTGHCKTETAMAIFIEYTVVTERENQFIVKRRYSDFYWLMKHLQDKFPLYILPPIPPKRIFVTIDKFSRQFVNERQKALERMLQRLSYFQNCIEDPYTQAFLKFNQRDFIVYRKTHKNLSRINFFRLSINRIYSDTVLAIKGHQTCDAKDESTVTCFEIMHKRIIERSTLTLCRESLQNINGEHEHFSRCLLWIAQNIADVVLMSETSEITIMMDGVAQFFFNWSRESKLHFHSLFHDLNPIINEYIAYDNNVIEMIRHRNQAKATLNLKKKQLFSIQSELAPHGFDSLPKGNKYDTLMAESIVLEDRLTDFERMFIPSFSDWQSQKSRDTAKWLNVMVQSNIKYHKACLDLCKSLLNKILTDF